MLLKKLLKRIFLYLPIRVSCLVQSIYLGEKLDIGKGSFVHPSVHVLRKGYIHIGNNTCVSERSWLNVNHCKDGKIAIDIGDHCFIGKDNFFTSGKKIIIRPYVLTTIHCRFIGSSHIIDEPLEPYLTTGTTDTDVIYIGVNCFIGAGSTILGHVKIGHGSVIGAGSFVLNDVPPFSLVVGNPAKVVKRYSFSKKAWVKYTDYDIQDDHLIPDEERYLKNMQEQHPELSLPWIAAGRSMGNL